MNDITLLYTAEYAMQNADNAADNDADYLLGELGADIKGLPQNWAMNFKPLTAVPMHSEHHWAPIMPSMVGRTSF